MLGKLKKQLMPSERLRRLSALPKLLRKLDWKSSVKPKRRRLDSIV